VNRKTIFNLLKIIVSLALIILIWRSIDLNALKTVLLNANLAWLGATLVLVFTGVVIRARRWQVLLDVFKVGVSLKELTLIYLIGFAFNNILPSGVGGDAIRMVELNRYTSRASDAVTSVIVERFLGLYGSLVLGFVTLLFTWRVVPLQIALVLLVVFIGITGIGVALMYEPLYRLLRRIGPVRKVTDIGFISSLFDSFQQYNGRALLRAFAVGLVFNVVLIGINVTIGLALGINMSLAYYVLFVPLVAVTLALPISFAGLGPREGTYIFLFGQVGVPGEIALALSLLVYIFGNLTPGLVGGAIYLWRGARDLQVAKDELPITNDE